jgi:hypothetical protein
MVLPRRNVMRRAWPAIFIAFLVIASGSAQQGIPRMTVFPQIVAGGPWSSDFFVTNQGLTTIQGVELALFKDSGDPMVVDTPDRGTASVFKFNLRPGETEVIRATRGPKVADVQGFAELFCPPGTSVRATMIVRYAPGGQPASQLGFPEQFPFSHFSFPGEVSGQANTGMAIAIPTYGYADIPNQRVLVSVLDPDGTLIDTKEVPLSAGKHTAFFLGELFPTLGNFRGRVIVSGSDWLGVSALRMEGVTLGAVSVDEGVALAPFFLNADAIGEAEPNDDPNSAQTITSPAVVSAVIGSKSDVDYYRFTGRQGDIVSTLVETISLDSSSDLDSELSLLTAEGKEIAWNDQNGSGGRSRNDSLVRMVLPADGTYYIRVSDCEGNGGASYRYKLHVKVQAH